MLVISCPRFDCIVVVIKSENGSREYKLICILASPLCEQGFLGHSPKESCTVVL